MKLWHQHLLFRFWHGFWDELCYRLCLFAFIICHLIYQSHDIVIILDRLILSTFFNMSLISAKSGSSSIISRISREIIIRRCTSSLYLMQHPKEQLHYLQQHFNLWCTAFFIRNSCCHCIIFRILFFRFCNRSLFGKQ